MSKKCRKYPVTLVLDEVSCRNRLIDLLLCEGSMCLNNFVEVTASLFNWNSLFTWYIPQEFLQQNHRWPGSLHNLYNSLLLMSSATGGTKQIRKSCNLRRVLHRGMIDDTKQIRKCSNLHRAGHRHISLWHGFLCIVVCACFLFFVRMVDDTKIAWAIR